MKTGDIVLFKPTKWDLLGKIICYFTKAPYSHSAIYLWGGMILEISPLKIGRMFLSEKTNSYDVYNLPKTLSEKTIKKEVAKTYVECSTKMKWYDIPNALFFIILRGFKLYKYRWIMRMFESDHAVICSEVAADYLTRLKVKKNKYKNIPNSLIAPAELPEMFKINKGK